MSRRYKAYGLIILIMAVMSFFLTGCSLANPELQHLKNGDELIGVFVAFKEDLKNYEMQEGDTLYYQEKKLVRADGSTKKLTNEELKAYDNGFHVEGKKQKNGCYTFDDIDGYYMGYTEKHFVEKGETYSDIEGNFSDEIYDTHIGSALNIFENEEEAGEKVYSLEGTIGVNSKKEGQIKINSVYKRADGSVYAVIPAPSIIIMDANSTGGKETMAVSESYGTNITGTGIGSKVAKTTSKFSVSVEQTDYLESAVVRQMDKNNKLVKVTDVDLTKKNQELKLDEKQTML
ncbi:hypothetical protein [Aminipila terrae]|uniref:Uncharacterized protein n=1 Tax=Aminipila terrae TaxID=2697030 RepID=A0A6P1MAU8_9FIRM|nr:hypothetical protein [Aminipila terrae]QHI71162.1 hypothetical protein Ami3637_01055 [Aminipila terrae]